MKSISEGVKNKIKNASIFVLGVIVTIIITKLSDTLIPNEPILVRQYTDTIKIVHDYKIPENLNNDSANLELERKLKNIELLNKYDNQIEVKLKSIQNKNEILPNLILTHNTGKVGKKGYTQGNSSSYFSSDCPNLNSKYLDIVIDFLNPLLTKDIACLRVNIYQENSTGVRTYILEEFYEVRDKSNLIRIDNDFEKGKYEIVYGFMFKNDFEKEFPSFYLKKCIVTK